MSFRVSSGGKSASPRRALVVSIVLLAATCALAASMSWRRSADTLGERLAPAGWDISFSPPKRFQPAGQSSNRSGFEYRFRGEWLDDRSLILIFRGVAPTHAAGVPRDQSIGDFGDSAMSSRAFSFGSVSTLPKSSRVSIGSLPGAEVGNLDVGTIVRAAVSSEGARYAVVLSTGGRPIDRPLYELFDLVCASVRYVAG